MNHSTRRHPRYFVSLFIDIFPTNCQTKAHVKFLSTSKLSDFIHRTIASSLAPFPFHFYPAIIYTSLATCHLKLIFIYT